MIPPFNQDGYLPEGIYDCTTEDVTERFGAYQTSGRRSQLCAKLTEFIRDAKAGAFMEAVLIDGSFVTSKPDPNDIDIVLVVAANYDFSKNLSPALYNLLAQHRVRRRFGFDIVVVQNGSENFKQAVAFFQQVKQRPGIKKGILRIKL